MPTMEYSVTSPQGEQGTMDEAHIASELGKLGYNPQGVSADGLHVTLQDDKGAYNVPISDALEQVGWKVNNAKPMNADYSNIQPEWRAAVSSFQDDDMSRAYLQAKMKKAGQPDAMVHGSGRDWYVYNPQTSQWVGVTNQPGEWGTADLAEAGVAAPRLIGSTLGSAGGALLGGGTPGSIAGAALGGTLGSAAGDSLTRAGFSALDPDYGAVTKANMGKVASDVTGNALVDGAVGGAFRAAPAAVQGLLRTGPASTVARGAGKAAEAAGTLGAKAGNLLDNELGRGALTQFVPGLGSVQNAGWALRAPAAVAKGAVKGAAWVGDNATVKSVAPGFARTARNAATSLGADAGPSGGTFAQRLADFVRGGSEEGGLTTEGILKNAGAAPEKTIVRNAYRAARQHGIPANQAMGIGKDAVTDLSPGIQSAIKKAPVVGGKIGRLADQAETVGRTLENAAEAPVGAAIKGAKYGGRALATGGRVLDQVGTALQPMENQLYGMYGAEEMVPKKRGLQGPWRSDISPDTMDAILALQSRNQ